MKRFTPVNKIALCASRAILVILALLPFHAFLTVWLSSLLSHYTLIRLWKEVLLTLIVLAAFYLLIKNRQLAQNLFRLWVTRLILAYALLLVICAVVAKINNAVSTKAMWYGLLVDLRFLIFFLAVLVIAACSGILAENWRKILIIPAVLVVAFAILQYLALPYDFLTHFGYSDSTISPYETINHNLNHIRVASTLRGANPLGAYLILPLSVLAVAFMKEKKQRFNLTILLVGILMALAFSFSRSAWIGAVVALAVAVWLSIGALRTKRFFAWVAIGVVVVCAGLGLLLRNNLTFENYLLHTDKASTAAQSSNQGHVAAFKLSAKDIVHQPLGRGIGTAGPQSVYNNHPARIAENYYLQIGQEAGIIGVGLFIAVCVVIGQMLYVRRADPLALALFASLIGICIVNLLSHAWTDDTLAYIWWGLAAVALAPEISTQKNTLQK